MVKSPGNPGPQVFGAMDTAMFAMKIQNRRVER